jgi:drug/metabolite transporter (DMT)-like permease
MKCSVVTAIAFVIITILYGSSYAVVSKGLKYFSAGAFQTLRMSTALVGTLVILLVRYITNNKSIRQHIRHDINSKTIFWLIIGGLVNLGVPHCLITVGQAWVSSASVQLMQPFATAAGAIFGHFFFDDEPFTLTKGISIGLSLVGVALTGVPSFLHAGTEGSKVTIGNLVLGYGLVIISLIMFGVAPGIFKLKTPNIDITFSVAIQLIPSTIFCFLWSLIFDGTSSLFDSIKNAPLEAFIWPVIVGILVSCVAVHGFMYLIGEIGVFGSNLVPFGQIIVGVVVGVAFLDEWAEFEIWEIALCCFGILFLLGSMYIGIAGSLRKELESEEEESSSQMERGEVELIPGYPIPEEL